MVSSNAIMTAPDVLPDFNERVHSDTWWKVKTGWSDTEYLGRKNALLKEIRRRWPNKVGEHGSSILADGIESLVATFDDTSWCLPGEPDRAVVFAEQLRLYTKWAKHIQSDSKHMPKDKLYTMPVSSINPSMPLLARSVNSPSLPMPQASQVSQSSTKPVTTVTSATGSAASSSLSIDQPFDWDNVEIHVYDKVAGNICIHVPMTAVRPGCPGEPCHWYEFSFDTFLHCLVQQTSSSYTNGLHFIFWVDGRKWAQIRSSGDYKIMLKRFSEDAAERHILKLVVQRCSDGDGPNGAYSATPTLFE